MKNSVRLRHHTFDGLREMGGFGQPLHLLYPQIRTLLASELGADAGGLLAEPTVDRANNRIEWYGESDPDQKPVPVSDLPEAERQPIVSNINDLLKRARELAERYASSEDARKAQLGAILQAVLVTPAETDLFLVEGKPVITGWGFTPDRPWDAPGPSPDRPPEVGEPAQPLRDVVVPEVAVPDLAPAVLEPKSPPQPVAESVQPAHSPPPPPNPISEQPPPLLPKRSARAEKKPASATSHSKPVEKVASASVTKPPEAQERVALVPPPSSLRYVVVGSRYFWGVAIIALLALLLAAYWSLARARSPAVMTDQEAAAVTAGDGKLAEALRHAQQTEGELRSRLEQLQIELASRRGQCRLSQDGAMAETPLSIPGKAGSTTAGRSISPADHHDGLAAGTGNKAEGAATGSAARDAGSELPTVASRADTTGPMPAPRPQNPTTDSLDPHRPERLDTASGGEGQERPSAGSAPVSNGSPGGTIPAGRSTGERDTPPTSAATDPAARAVNPRVADSADTARPASLPSLPSGSSAKPVNPPSPGGSTPPDASSSSSADRPLSTAVPTPSTLDNAPSTRTGSPPAGASESVTAGSERAGRSLEDMLTEKAAKPGATTATPTPIPTQSPAERPVKTEPTAEERREFDKRMSATGASSGEITATLLWNSRSDLDLVVRCPSGRQLDFRNAAECGGSLDVDANISRSQLTDRPVENAFWPAGKAEPGLYEVFVRYAPRKDEERPQDTPFQVRLSRGGQESVFKGSIRPNTLAPITTFTVQR